MAPQIHLDVHRPRMVLVMVLIGLFCFQDMVSATGGVRFPARPPIAPSAPPSEDLKVFVVYMGEKPKSALLAIQMYRIMINTILGKNGTDALLWSYTKSFSGFAVRMNEHHKSLMSKLKGIVSIFESKTRHIQTTRSWDFMGFPLTVNHSTTESDIIVGVFDTGAWPQSASFSDVGLGPPPLKWKGSCTPPVADFTCNNKIVGGKYFKADGLFSATDLPSPIDTNGHGTHTPSTAAGAVVTGASMLGLGYGIARGGVPAARVAIYKICWSNGCHDADILAAFDEAIADGVDIISLSVGGSDAKNYFEDYIAIGSYHAMKNGIFTSVAAGNDGPNFFTTTNVAPWTLGVAASTTDRKLVTSVQLGNSLAYQGVSVNTFDISSSQYPLIYGGDAPAAGFDPTTSALCLDNSLDPLMVREKIVVCESLGDGEAAFVAGAAGALYTDEGFKDVAWQTALSASYLDLQSGADILTYMSLNTNPTATIFKTVNVTDKTAPVVASFSSRGPSQVTPDILKPDISAPGVNILAAWPTVAPVTKVPGDTRSVNYNLDSGTSMACPHASGVAAFIKSFNPTWSPAAIKSAMMTTAVPMSLVTGFSAAAEYAYGAGHINPLKALNPGLVYDASATDYKNFLCADGYTTADLRKVTGDLSECPTVPGSVHDLNYPSFSLATFTPESIPITTYRRTLTNVGSSSSIYKATITYLDGLNIQVTPDILTFTSIGESLPYTLTISGTFDTTLTVGSCSITWDDGVHQVRSPIAVVGVVRT